MPHGVFSDLTGQRFGRLTVLGLFNHDGGRARWRCLCDCGNECVCRTDAFKTQRSCGCIRNEKNIQRFHKHGDARTHLYKVHTRLIQATSNPNYWTYKNYGGKGVKLAPQWREWPAFKKWALENGYQRGRQIHRKDEDGDYCPENCVWLSAEEHRQIHAKKRAKTIEQLDDNGNVVATYLGYSDLSKRFAGIDMGGVRRSFRDGYRCHGFRWRITSTD